MPPDTPDRATPKPAATRSRAPPTLRQLRTQRSGRRPRMSAAGPLQGANCAPNGAAQRPHWPMRPQAWGAHERRRQDAPRLQLQRHDAARRRGARARARSRRSAALAHRAVPEGARPLRRPCAKATCSSRARRKRVFSATSPRTRARRRRSASSTSARPPAGRPKRAPRRPRSRPCSRWRRCPSRSRCRASPSNRKGGC